MSWHNTTSFVTLCTSPSYFPLITCIRNINTSRSFSSPPRISSVSICRPLLLFVPHCLISRHKLVLQTLILFVHVVSLFVYFFLYHPYRSCLGPTPLLSFAPLNLVAHCKTSSFSSLLSLRFSLTVSSFFLFLSLVFFNLQSVPLCPDSITQFTSFTLISPLPARPYFTSLQPSLH